MNKSQEADPIAILAWAAPLFYLIFFLIGVFAFIAVTALLVRPMPLNSVKSPLDQWAIPRRAELVLFSRIQVTQSIWFKHNLANGACGLFSLSME